MEVAVFSVSDSFTFVLEGPSFWWLKLFFLQPNIHENIFVLKDNSSFFSDFILNAKSFWKKSNLRPFKAGPWIETDNSGCELPFKATVMTEDGQRILILSQIGDSYRRQVKMLQVGREHVLHKERLETEVSKRTKLVRVREEEVANRLLAASGYRDLETGAHIKRIGLYSEAIAKALGWSQLHVDDIRVAAPMHDVGKIGIADRILLKPGRLDKNEFEIMKTHTQLGAKMLEGTEIEMIEMARNIAQYHHEKWDGSGYPEGLIGEDIPIEARIVSIVDVYDAMVHKRIYKEPISEDDTIHYIRSASNSHFDPSIVETFFNNIEEIREIRNITCDFIFQ
jgi:response regulator RpfG family c-di-GMP phosphodiesterase